MDQKDVDVVHPVDKERGITLEDFKLIKIGMFGSIQARIGFIDCQILAELGLSPASFRAILIIRIDVLVHLVVVVVFIFPPDVRLLANYTHYLRQRVVATAVAYMRRFYTRHGKWMCGVEDICEMKILEALNDYLLVFHPYHSLSRLLQDSGMNDNDMIQSTWRVVNDTYLTDLILVHPPHLIALACIFITSVQKEKDPTIWFGGLNVDMNVVQNISLEILDLYENIRSITETRLHAAFGKLRKLENYRVTSSRVKTSS